MESEYTLEELRDAVGKDFTEPMRRQFWRHVGRIKREVEPDLDEVAMAAEIREMLHTKRFGEPHPLFPWVAVLNLIGILFFALAFAEGRDEDGWGLAWISTLLVAALSFTWAHLARKPYVYALAASLLTALLNLGSMMLFPPLFLDTLHLYFIPAVPAFYLNGRLLGSKIAGVKSRGISPDPFGLFTLKIDYESYLLARPDRRQYIFLLGGLGTVATLVVGGSLSLVFFGDPIVLVVGILLLLGELLDYAGKAGKLGGGELAHVRRERKIAKDWKKLRGG